VEAFYLKPEQQTMETMATSAGILSLPENEPEASSEQPDFLSDLNLDRIIEAVTAHKEEYDLKPFFWTPLRDPELVRYRQEVMRDLEDEAVMACIQAFAEKMRTVRRYLALAEKLDYEYHKKGWILEAALVYGDAVITLAHDLAAMPLKSRGLLAFCKWVQGFAQAPAFVSFVVEAQQVKVALAELKYCVIIESGKFKVKRYEGEVDYSIEIERIFEKFRQGDVDSYLVRLPEHFGMSHIEAQILGFVARLYPEPFAALDDFCAHHARFLDETIQAFDREIQFYVAYLDFLAEFKRKGLPFCYPRVSTADKAEFVRDGFDLALALAKRDEANAIVLNDFSLEGPERIIVVTGPNQGGKTTFARMVGQIHYLASLGCPVPGREARVFLCDRIFTHFERVEDIHNLRGKLEDDLFRIHEMLSRATPDSLFILNEIFTSTTLKDAIFLSREIMARLIELDTLGVWVTFLDELASLGEKTVSMVATVDPTDPSVRTFKIVRRRGDGLAYARALAQKHRLTYEQIKGRIVR
jgi:DNA mismatch repair protein MutS